MTPTIDLIPKEDIRKYHFVHHEVLGTPEERRVRYANLSKAMILGNAHKGKVKIVFETEEGIKAVETTIWSTDENEITLKGGINIPMQSIKEVFI
jgi:hypothetical protein